MRTTRAHLVLFAFVIAVLAGASWPRAQALQKVTINYPTRSGASWHLYIAKEGGYYQKYGLDVDLQFGVHPAGVAMLTSGQAVMVNHSLEQGMIAGVRDPNTFTLMGSTSNKGLFALVAQKGVTLKELKGKRFAVGQIGDAPYNYTVALLGTLGLGSRDVQWIPVGTDVSGRAAALQTNRADATLLTAPNYFRLEEAGFPVLANLADNPLDLGQAPGRSIAVGLPQPRAQHMLAAEDIQRQIAVAVVIAVEEAPFLLAMQWQVGCVYIQNDLFGACF